MSAMRRFDIAVLRLVVSSFSRISFSFLAWVCAASALATEIAWLARFSTSSLTSSSTSFSPCFTMVPSGTMKMTVDWPSTSERTMVSRSACSSAFSRTVIGRSSRRKVNRLPSWACCSAVEAPQAASSAARASRERW